MPKIYPAGINLKASVQLFFRKQDFNI